MGIFNDLIILSNDFEVKAGRNPKSLNYHDLLAEAHTNLIHYHIKEKNKAFTKADTCHPSHKAHYEAIAKWHDQQMCKHANEEHHATVESKKGK